MAGSSMASKIKKTVKKVKKKVSRGCLYVTATFNNTIISLTDEAGNTLAQSSAGTEVRGARKSTPYAAQAAAGKLAAKAKEVFSMEYVKVFVKGPGPGREAFRALGNNTIKVLSITDITGVAHNGPRPRKEKRN